MEAREDLSCAAYTAALASDAPVPGGGGAAALCGALAASLLSMASRISARRAGAELAALAERAETLRGELLALMDGDEAGFQPLARAYALPKDAPERDRILRDASLAACAAPLQMLERCRDTAELLNAGEERVSPLLLSDLGCAAALCRGAMEAAGMNIWVNLKGRDEDPEAEALRRRAHELLEDCLPRLSALTERVRRRLEGDCL